MISHARKKTLAKMAREYASAWLDVDSEANDLSDELTIEEDYFVREKVKEIAESIK